MSQIVNIVAVTNLLGKDRDDVGLSVPEDAELIELVRHTGADLWTCWPVDVTFLDTATTEEYCTCMVVLKSDGAQFIHILGADGEYRRRIEG